MKSLNEIVQGVVDFRWCEVQTEINFDESLPSKYENPDDLRRALDELLSEVNRHSKPSIGRAVTKLDGKLQTIEFAWNGESLSEKQISKINRRYQIGANDMEESDILGTRRAGFLLAQYKGTVRIENCTDDPYAVRNIIQLPVDYK
jgi:hypothetical protein